MAARRGVTVDDVRSAAIKVVKRGSNLTVAAVAEELLIHPPSIYHHVPDGLFGLTEMVHQHCREWMRMELHTRIERTPEALLWMLWKMAHAKPFLYDFHSEEWEHEHELRSRVDNHLLPLMAVMTHDYAAALLNRIFDAE